MLLPAQRYVSADTSYDPVSVCVCLSVTSRSSVETDGRIELVFLARELPSVYPTLCSEGNWRFFKNNATYL